MVSLFQGRCHIGLGPGPNMASQAAIISQCRGAAPCTSFHYNNGRSCIPGRRRWVQFLQLETMGILKYINNSLQASGCNSQIINRETTMHSHISPHRLIYISGSDFEGWKAIWWRQSANFSCHRRPLIGRPYIALAISKIWPSNDPYPGPASI